MSTESQCGFRKGRGCTDMIFVIRQLVEQLVDKSWEHRSKAFFIFIDLKKAYDSVSREAMWLALDKLGAPQKFVKLIKSFHDDTKAAIRLDGAAVEERLMCTTCLVVERWLVKIEEKIE